MDQLLDTVQGGTTWITLETGPAGSVFMSTELSGYFPGGGPSRPGYYRIKTAGIEIEPHFDAAGYPVLPAAPYTVYDLEPAVGFQKDLIRREAYLATGAFRSSWTTTSSRIRSSAMPG